VGQRPGQPGHRGDVQAVAQPRDALAGGAALLNVLGVPRGTFLGTSCATEYLKRDRLARCLGSQT
jgi:hypothetical protein